MRDPGTVICFFVGNEPSGFLAPLVWLFGDILERLAIFFDVLELTAFLSILRFVAFDP